MFLNEVALGVEHHITRDDSSFVHAPKGKDCVIGNFCFLFILKIIDV